MDTVDPLPHPPSDRPATAALRTAIVMVCLMVLTAAGGLLLRPTTKLSSSEPRYLLSDIVPRQFGEWREVVPTTAQVVNPEAKRLLDQLYSQLLMRTYVHSSGYRVMVALAYGDDQRGSLEAHLPEVCYPAQGFVLESRSEVQLATAFGNIAARRLGTSQGLRKEPVTYWFTVGGTPVTNRFSQRMVEMRLGLTGQIPDGLLFRMSSIDDVPARAYQFHDAFVDALLKAVPARDRARLSGLKEPAPG